MIKTIDRFHDHQGWEQEDLFAITILKGPGFNWKEYATPRSNDLVLKTVTFVSASTQNDMQNVG